MNDSRTTGTARRPAISAADRHDEFVFRNPTANDAVAVNDLVASCPPLDRNSLYCNLLQCTHFANTCILAERDGRIEGWISGYRLTDDPDAMFVWQVAVHEDARGQGLGVAMLDALWEQPAVFDAMRLVTTVTPSNIKSRRMFAEFARQRGGDVEIGPGFESDRHLGGAQESEELLSIGPLRTVAHF